MTYLDDRIWISELPDHVGETVRLAGWVYNRRSSGKIQFILLRDGSSRVQCVVSPDDVGDEKFAELDRVTMESSVWVRGTVREDKRAPSGVEVTIHDFGIIALAAEYPIQKKDHGVDFLLDHRHLWLRSARQETVMRVRSTAEEAVHDFFRERGYLRVDAPIFTPAACEGTTTLFETDYFGDSAYLSQSGQLYNEAAAAALGRVYCFGPTFRAEKSKTRRHANEFWQVEPEAAFMDLDGCIELAEGLICRMVTDVLEKRRPELDSLERDVSKLENVEPPFPRITYAEALELLSEKGITVDDKEGFGAEDETVLGESFDKPVVVHRYPHWCKAFYMKRDPDDDELTLSMDIIAPEGYGEIVGGSQREDDYETLLKRIDEHNLPPESLEWYLDLRRYGAAPSSGFGMGLDRTVAWITGVKHIRETLPFPRLLNRIYP
ncbi:MAG: asparagine--tRNA ligase [Candidatus Coatesbacteria bacterium]|nr:MAG: asparagine--tRNA ligase [Candidatus Coatesbacteria bacterium]